MPIEVAFALLREGRVVEAEELMAREVKAVTKKHGRGSTAWAAAQCDLGSLLLNCDRMGRAIECFRDAASVAPGQDYEAARDQLSYRMNLGMVLRMAGRLDEAETELRRGAEDRLAFYGREHAGYAFGLEPLAELLLQRGNLREARPVIDETVANFWRNGHERVATALALRAEIVRAEGAEGSLFGDLAQLPDHVVEQVCASVLNRAGHGDQTIYQAVLADLVAVLEARLGPDHQATLNALSQLANTGRERGD
ncbi:tetratricopeptide repeat protein [Asanoa ferruginea]|uniref:Tetratricopeptide repeat protein n=2 Tax=Asanoa ferruginea TaxID=53367 RepID=A0A3D9ZNC0_9ACTN|nr:tetratricopeptide repeat protein [Asanoa ferruginea]GIF48273.1 hypothetical protein Afe04nite_28120 [Asanoa ferruginea]